MSNIIPFAFESHTVRVVKDEHGEPLFVGKDVCDTLGFANDSDAMKRHCKGVVKRYPLQTPGGMQELRVLTEPDVLRLIVNCSLPAAEAFERLVFEEILPTIRKTGSYGQNQSAPSAIAPAKEFRALFGIGRLIGLDKNAAAISANQAVTTLTGTNVLKLLGRTHLEAENQEDLFFTPSELGLRFSVSGFRFNKMLEDFGLQTKNDGVWTPTEKGKQYVRIMDTGKRHGMGVMVQQIKWSESVIDLLKKSA